MDAVGLFHGEVSEDLLLKERPFEALRTKLLHGAADFYGKLEGLLAGQTDPASRAALARAYDALGELTEKIGSKPEALAVHRKALAVRRELAAATGADVATWVDVARSLLAVGWIQQRTGDMSGALSSYEESLRLVDRLMANGSAGDHPRAVQGLAHERIARLYSYFDTAKQVEALSAYRQSIAVRQKLAEANPSSAQYQRDLAECHYGIGSLLANAGKPVEAMAAHQQALAIRLKLATAQPNVIQWQFDLARSHDWIGYLLKIAGKPGEALAAFERALAIREKVVEANPNVTQFQFDLAHSIHQIGWVLTETGKTAEALAGDERAVAILRKLVEANPSDVIYQSELALLHSSTGELQWKLGRTADAVVSVRRAVAIWTRLSRLSPNDLYNLSCSHAMLASLAAEPSSGMTAVEGRSEADRAMECLHQAVAGGYRKLIILRTDTDLDSLRSRDDFRLLMMDLEFPDALFVRGD
jgi:tetratricopeptide (TPR) repeat protein